MTRYSVERLATHIVELCAAFNVIHETRPMELLPQGGAAGTLEADASLPLVQRRRGIIVPPVIDEATYAICLHELGHTLSPMGMINDKQKPDTAAEVRLQLEEERAAWAWAKHYALDWTPTMEHMMQLGLTSYEQRARALLGPRWSKPPGPRKLKVKRVTGRTFVVLEDDEPKAFVRKTPARVVVQSGTLTASEYAAVCRALEKTR